MDTSQRSSNRAYLMAVSGLFAKSTYYFFLIAKKKSEMDSRSFADIVVEGYLESYQLAV